ncbi:site-specific DNA-methyltransferase [Mesorhizobium sp. M0959]|uniref:site-specific DNA-methyltransferase n=1 Tax=Mesorhizobium sp. M0959 TaxID=2957034 RepID=UPI00333BA0F7
MSLTDREKEQLKALIDSGQPLPARYKAILFDQPHEAELIWPGKTSEVTNVVLPFQSIEQIDEPRPGTEAGTPDLFAFDQGTGRQSGGWTNKLIWGDNKLVLASLKSGPLRREIEAAGGLKLVYIDPPFDIGADFSVALDVGGESLTKAPSLIEELAYRDTWGRGTDSYLHMINERLRLICDLLSTNGSLYVQVGWSVSHYVKIVLDEILGRGRFLNQIVWKRQTAHSDTGQGAEHFGRLHDVILFYSKTDTYTLNMQYSPYDERYLETHYKGVESETGRRYELDNLTAPGGAGKGNPQYEFLGVTRYWRYKKENMESLFNKGRIVQPSPGAVPRYKRYLDEMPGVPLQDLWLDVNAINSQAIEAVGYATQKPTALLERIIRASSNEGDLVADFFCGSGTSLAVAEKLGRKWIGCDLGRFAIHTSRKRLIAMQRELKGAGKRYRSFEILNLGKYERQFFAGINPTLPEEQRRALSLQKEEHYLTLILAAYKADRVFQSPPFHGRKLGALVLVGPIDAPVTQAQVHEAVEAARKLRVSKLDILGFEFEMGLVPHAQDEARAKGVNVALRYIPKDVFDRRSIDRGQVVFYDVAYVEIQPVVKGMTVTIALKDYGVYYRQDDVEALIESMKNGGSKVTVECGQIVKIAKDKKGVVTREVLTKAWADWVDYWAVDFDFENRKEIVRITEASGSERETWTGGYIFENEWQSFRTRQDRTLELTSAAHEYQKKGRYKIAVKVIDIFGNDTTKVVEVSL